MKRLTMVMRCGNAKAAPEAMIYTLIGEDYSFTRMSGTDIVKALGAGQIEFTNMGIEKGKLVSTNGALNKYTLIDETGNAATPPKAVILDRVEDKVKGLLGYTIYMPNGTLKEIDVNSAVQFTNNGLVANGKIRHTQQGDIVASIGGVYPLRVIQISAVKDDSITVDIMFFSSALDGSGKAVRYAGIIVNGKNAVTISKLHDTLNKDNTELLSKLIKVSGDTNLKNVLGIKVTGTAGFYGVYSLQSVWNMIEKAGDIVSLPMGNVMIGCIDYKDAEHPESNVTLNNDLSAAGRQSGTASGDESLKAYVKTVLEKLKTVKIAK